MNIDELTIGQAKELAAMFGNTGSPDNGMIGKYVIVRCRDAGVHAGVLVNHSGRECTLSEARRLWRWKNKEDHKSLSGIATAGLDETESKVGAPVSIILTENCEIILCSSNAEASIRGCKSNG